MQQNHYPMMYGGQAYPHDTAYQGHYQQHVPSSYGNAMQYTQSPELTHHHSMALFAQYDYAHTPACNGGREAMVATRLEPQAAVAPPPTATTGDGRFVRPGGSPETSAPQKLTWVPPKPTVEFAPTSLHETTSAPQRLTRVTPKPTKPTVDLAPTAVREIAEPDPPLTSEAPAHIVQIPTSTHSESEYLRILNMTRTEFNRFRRASPASVEEVNELRKARRRKNNRLYAKRARGKRAAKLNELNATISHLSALASGSTRSGDTSAMPNDAKEHASPDLHISL